MRFAMLVWVVFACAIVIAVCSKKNLTDRSVTPEYHRAALAWWQSQPVYTDGVHGFLYLPQAAMVYTPFALLPPVLEETLWRLVGILLYASGIRGLCRRFADDSGGTGSATHRVLGPPSRAFLLASALGVFAAMGSAQNGQTNLHMGGLFALAACAVMDRRFWTATLWLLLALALKPIALVLVLLFGAIWLRSMSWRLAIGLVLLSLAPFLHTNPGYAIDQYRLFIEKSSRSAAPIDLFQDIRGLLESFRAHVPERGLTGIRAGAAVVTLGLGWLAARRFSAPVAAMFVLTLGTIYLMLFNPRTEGVTYAILGPAAALWATREIVARRWTAAVPLILLCLLLQFSRLVTGGSNYWVRPLCTLVFAGYVSLEVVRGATGWLRSTVTPLRSRETPPLPPAAS